MTLIIQNDDKYINFTLESKKNALITTAYANSLRRILLTSIKSLGFKYIPYKHLDNFIIITENGTTNIHNDKLSKRLSLLTINTPCIKLLVLLYLITNDILPDNINIKSYLKLHNIKQYLNDILFKINVSNTSNTIKYTTTDMIDIYLKDTKLQDIDLSKLTDAHYKLFEYFKLDDLVLLLKQSNLSEFNDNIRFIIFNHIELKNITINDNLVESRIYPKLITELNHKDNLSIEMKLSIGKNLDDCTWDVISTISYSFGKDFDIIKEKLTDITKNIDDKLQSINYSTNRWDNVEHFIITNELINERNMIQDTELRALIKEKDLLIQRFNIHDSYRVYIKNDENIPSKFNLSYKYEGIHNNERILYKGFKELNLQIKHFKNLFKNIINIPYKDNHINILYSPDLEEAVDIYVENSSHTILNLINDYLYYLIISKEKYYYTAYNRVHKLGNQYLLRLITNNFKEDINKVCDYLLELTNNIMKSFN
jgi:DNA-directed RNA polymerase subunit L